MNLRKHLTVTNVGRVAIIAAAGVPGLVLTAIDAKHTAPVPAGWGQGVKYVPPKPCPLCGREHLSTIACPKR